MHDSIFQGIFATSGESVISVGDFLLCIGCSLIIGIILAFSYMYRTRYTKSFVITLALLPAAVCAVIMMVNGNIGAGVAVAGAFSLVRFRSAQGTAKEIGIIFIAMGAGLIAGMGYLAYALLFAVLLCCISVIYTGLSANTGKNMLKYRTLHITIPEDLDYAGVFDGTLAEYADSFELTNVKTSNMGSLFKLTYDLVLRETGREKEMIDRLRCLNGNLEISLSVQENPQTEL